MRAAFIGFLAGVVAAAAAWAAMRGRRMVEAPEVEEAVAVAAPVVSERRGLENRLSEVRGRLESAATARPGSMAAGRGVPDDEVVRWIIGAVTGDGPMTGRSEEAEVWINLLLEWLSEERGVEQVDLEFGPLRERYIVAYLKARGVPLDGEQARQFAAFLGDADTWFAGHLSATGGATAEERLISGLRGTADWEDRMLAMLRPAQLEKLDEIAVLLDQWRWMPACSPLEIDPYDGVESELNKLRNQDVHGGFESAREILRDHMTQCIALHNEVQKSRLEDRKSISDVEEFCRFLEIRAATRRRLLKEAQIREEMIPRPYLLDYAMPAKEDR
ncbi:MAG: hypothetical protein HYY18_02400 [Planctomycetes bacterium]|nr:hypothetical protein [Planctomycetota bacterium]